MWVTVQDTGPDHSLHGRHCEGGRDSPPWFPTSLTIREVVNTSGRLASAREALVCRFSGEKRHGPLAEQSHEKAGCGVARGRGSWEAGRVGEEGLVRERMAVNRPQGWERVLWLGEAARKSSRQGRASRQKHPTERLWREG